MRERPPSRPYRLGRSRGQGGFAEVFEATRRGQNEPVVAFKRPREDVLLARERMRREIDVQRRFKHDHVMPILDADEHGGWFVMPLAAGNLEQLWTSGHLGRDPHVPVLDVLRQVSLGLEYAHELGFVHRDVTPRNILAFTDAEEARWVIGDWGAVRRARGDTSHRLTATGEGLGTRGFAAPETWRDAHHVDSRADVYSLGRVAAWLLTGEWPIPNVALIPKGPLARLVRECTRNEPDLRIASMADLRTKLEAALARPKLSPAQEGKVLVDRVLEGAADPMEVIALAATNEADEEMYIDEVARLPPDVVREMSHESADEMAAVALVMLRHLQTASWDDRHFDYANVPLRWVFEVLAALVGDDQLDLAEDVAVEFFRADRLRTRFRQLDITVAWLRRLNDVQGDVIARAMRESGAIDYYADELARGRIRNRTLAGMLREK